MVILYKKIIDKLKELTKNLSSDKSVPREQTSAYLGILAKLKKNKIKTIVSSVLGTSTVFTISTSQQAEHTQNENNNQNHVFKIRENKNPKQKRFAQQMVLINLLTGIGSVFSLLTNVQVTLSTNPYFDFLNKVLQNVSPVFRVIFLAIQSAIPIISIIYSPWSYSWREFKKKIINSDLITSIKMK